jgi:hypothetical protein
VELTVETPNVDTGKTPNPDLVTLQESAKLLEIPLTEMLHRATALGLSRVDGDGGPFLIRRELDAARTQRFDYSTDPFSSSWSLFWAGVSASSARSQSTKRLAQIVVDPHSKRERELFQKRIDCLDAAQLKFAANHKSAPQFSGADLMEIKKILFHGALCEARLAEIEAGKQAERDFFTQLRNCQSFAWESIKYFQTASENRGRVVGFAQLERTLLRQASHIARHDDRKRHIESRATAFADLQEKLKHLELVNPGIRESYRIMAANSRTEVLADLLAQIRQHARCRLPENWKRLLFGLRQFFFVAPEEPKVRKAAGGKLIRRKFNILALKPHLRQYAYADSLPAQLDIFNLFHYLVLSCGWKKTAALEFAGLVSFSHADSRDALDRARLYRNRFHRAFTVQK